jgi:hypothetical protein
MAPALFFTGGVVGAAGAAVGGSGVAVGGGAGLAEGEDVATAIGVVDTAGSGVGGGTLAAGAQAKRSRAAKVRRRMAATIVFLPPSEIAT